MTDSTTTTPAVPAPTVAQQIEAMVSSSASRAPGGSSEAAPVYVTQDRGGSMSITVDTASRQITDFAATGNPDTAPMPNGGITAVQARGEFENIGRQYQNLKERYDAHSFDPQTGEKVYALPDEQRARLETQLRQLVTTADYQRSVIGQLEQHEAAEASRRSHVLAEQQAKLAFTGGDTALAKAWDEAIVRREADAAVQLVLANRGR